MGEGIYGRMVEGKAMRNRASIAKTRSRRLRSQMSVSEIWMWARVRKDQLGFRFRRQFPVGPYILDFYCVEAKLAVEVDGELHSLRSEQDKRRDKFLSAQGIYVLRIPSQDLFDEENPLIGLRWLESIEQLCIERSGAEVSKRVKPKRDDWL